MPSWTKYNGRIVSGSIKWWAEHNPQLKKELLCKHRVSLVEPCDRCKDESES